MLEIPYKHVWQLLCLPFLVGMSLLVTNTPVFSLEIKCIHKERQALLNIQPECSSSYKDHLPDCCDWPGISCSNLTGQIYQFNLEEFLLNCLVNEGQELPLYVSHIGSFPELKYLLLCSSDPTRRAIPPELGNLTRLETLEVCSCYTFWATSLEILLHLTSLKRLVLPGVDLSQATDWVHVVNNLPSLEHLDLSDCFLSDVNYLPISTINSSKSLSFLDLSMNYLQATTFYPWIFNHTSLVSLSLASNYLNGSVPARFQMNSLSHLDLSNNQLEGGLPSSLKGLCRLQFLDLSQNQRLKGDLSGIFQSLSCANESLKVLSLHRNSFSGAVPDFTMFSRLSKLKLHSNRLNGTLPTNFIRPSRLVILDLHNNQLTGSVPDLSGFSLLEVLKLQNNRLNGTLHTGVGRLSRLRHLDISSNSLKGEIGVGHLSNLSNLRHLDMSFNSLAFNVGSTWVPSFRLDTIGLASCRLGPRFPEWLRTQANYLRLDMSDAGILDTIPFWFWNLSSSASFIGLSHNGLHGIIPNSSHIFHSNPAIDLSSNFLEGSIPSFLGDTAVYLNLSRNSFSGQVSFLCQMSLSSGIDLSHNFLSGKLPDRLSEVQFLTVLDLSNNNFFGELPDLGSFRRLQSLHLRENKFSGKLPSSLCNLTSLLYLDLGDNQFSGEIPRSIGHMLPNLTILSLRNNFFSGSIPPQLCHLSAIQILDLSLNNISGVIPNCLCSMTAMTRKASHATVISDSNDTFSSIGTPYKDYISVVLKGFMYEYKNNLELVKSIDLSGNNLEGEIPDEISCLSGLVSLNISRNKLTGHITSNIGLLKALESLDLSNNHLTGEIPPSLSELDFLGTLSLAYNNLSGTIPTGTQLQGFTASSFEGNPQLCGKPLPKRCPGDGGRKTNGVSEDNDKRHNEDLLLGLYISVALGFVAGFWGVCAILVFKRSWRYAYFRFWIHAYDWLYVMVALLVARIQRQS